MLDAHARARFVRNRAAVAGAAVVAALVLFALIGPWLARHDPYMSDFAHGGAATGMPVGPSPEFPLGADRIFRDVFARLATAGRISLLIAVAATAIATVIGASVGILAGYYEGARAPRIGPLRLDVDGLLMRAVDVMLAFPFLLLVMAIGAALVKTTAVTIFVVLGVTGWLGTARVLRSKTMQVRALDYVSAARALGQSAAKIMLRHVLPNVAGTLVVLATVQVAQMIVADSILSYLGVGVSPPTPTWGRMLFEGKDYFASAPWIVGAPAAAIVLAVWGFNMVGEGLRDALDPQESSGRASAKRSIRASLGLLAGGLASLGVLVVGMPMACTNGLRAPIPAPYDDAYSKPRHGGTLHLASVFDARNLDPAGPMDGLAMQAVLLLFDGLVDIDREGNAVPNLAEHWEVQDGGRSYRFTLRQGVLMHDGGELTADDVKRSLERALSPSTPSSVSSYFDGIVGYAAYASGKAEHLEGIVVEGRYVVAFELGKPDAAFLSLLATPAARPVCANAGNRYSRAWLPCGAGPFELQPGGWQRGTSLRIVRNPTYFRPGLPYLDAVEWTFLMDAVPQRFRFEDGQLDLLVNPTQADYGRFMSDVRWQSLGTPLAENGVWGEAMNTRLAPFDRVEIRRAVAAALDRDLFPRIKPANMAAASQLMPRGIPGYDPSWTCGGHDEAAALEHMRKAGFPFDPATGTGGWPEPITYTVADQTSNFFTAQIVQQQLAKIGLRIELRLVSYPAYLAIGERAGGTQMTPWGNQADYADPSAFFDPSFTTGMISPEGSNNVAFFSNSDYDAVVSRARHEMDPAARKTLYREANDILCDQAPWVFTWAQRDFVMRQPYVHGFAAHPIWPLDLRGVWLDPAGTGQESAPGAPR